MPSTTKRKPEKPWTITRHVSVVTREMLQWLWPGRIPLGKLTLLAGDPGLGKSLVTLDIAARVSTGAPWPDNSLTTQPKGNVILLNAEDDIADTIGPRLDRAGANDKRIIAIEGVADQDSKRPFCLETDLANLNGVLAQYPETRLVIVDPIAAYLGGVDSHKNSDVRGMLAPLAELASEHRVAVLSVTHLAKSGGPKAVYRAMGSLAFAAAARAVWCVVKDQHDPQRRLFLPGKLNLAQDPDGLAYRIKDGCVAWEADPVRLHADDAFAAEMRDANRRGDRGAERREAIEWLKEQLATGPVRASDLIEQGQQYGYGERTLQRALKALGGRSRKNSFDGPWVWELAKDEGDSKPPSV